ncbi:hypothetical protein N1037_07185 [Phaeobacter sp. G2]|nr:hypothetical protein N1037_07185 [Phaeobacter sp. G2]
MNRYTPRLLLQVLLFVACATSSVIAQSAPKNASLSSEPIALHELKDHIEGLQQRLETIEARQADSAILVEKVQWIERELTNSLMNISNVLDASSMNMDAAHATIEASQSAVSASEAYLSMGGFAAAILGIVAAFAAIAAAIAMEVTNRRIRNVASTAAEDIIKEFVSSSSDTPNHGTRKVLEAVRESVKEDLEETPALLMQNGEFKNMLTRLVDAAVSNKLSKPEDDDGGRKATFNTLDDDDFAK